MKASIIINSLKIAKYGLAFFSPKDRKVLKAITLSYLKRKPIRISFAYLYQIKNGHNFLLVFNKRSKQYQPIGGVYKAKPNSSLNNPEIAESDYFTKAPKDDFRAILKKPSFLKAFYEEFLSGKNRETDFYREFNEELLVTHILPSKLFSQKKLQASKISDTIKIEEGNDVINFYHFDIIGVNMSDAQIKSLEGLAPYEENKFLWVSREDMKKYGVYLDERINPRSIQEHQFLTIAPHSYSII